MLPLLFCRSSLVILLALLLALTGLRYWPYKRAAEPDVDFADETLPRVVPGLDSPPGDFPGPDGATRGRMAAMLQKLPPEQRKAVQERMEKDRAVFASVAKLPAEDRRQKIEEYFAENPPPPELGPGPDIPGGPGGPGGPGDPGNGGAFAVPPPAVRRGMDAGIANSQSH
jgi:hypothetical protein